MVANFSGWASKNDILCADDRIIKHGAFAEQNTMRVPLVWQHQYDAPENVLGHAILHHRPEGVWMEGFFNDSPSGQHAKEMVKHGDVDSLSIFANNLVQKGREVLHGVIREVSLVLAGANSGAKIVNVDLRHSLSDTDTMEGEAILESIGTIDGFDTLEHADTSNGDNVADTDGGKTVKEIYDAFTPEQKKVVNLLIGDAVENAESVQHGADLEHSDLLELGEDVELDDILKTYTPLQMEALQALVGEALETKNSDDTVDGDTVQHSLGGNNVTKNIFEQNGGESLNGSAIGTITKRPQLSHAMLTTITEDAKKLGSYKEAFLQHEETIKQTYGVENIDILFPDAKSLSNTPDVIGRRVEWVNDLISSTKHSPFSRIKSTAVDITADEARAKGYVKGNLKKEEVIKLLKRVTTPTTIYKKQKLDRDDIIDITDLDVVAWLKAEMRLMLDEELARAILIGDGREADDDDKIDEEHIRPIAFDHDMYAHQITVAANISSEALVEAILRSRVHYKGTGTPNLYTTDTIVTDLLLLKDKVGRRLYGTMQELAAALRVAKIVVVEVMETVPNLLGIVVNPSDYTLGADRGGAVSMFDDFDIDYNQYKYLIETRCSGTLTKPKSAVIIKRTAGNVVVPESPQYNETTHVLTFPTTAGVEYYRGDNKVTTGTVTLTETEEIEARPAEGYSFPHNIDTDWYFTYKA